MISFSKYLAESLDKEYSKYLKNFAILNSLVDRTSLYLDDVDDMIYAGKPIDKIMGFFKKYDKPAADVEEFALKDKAGKWKIESQDGLKAVERFKRLKERYFQRAKNFAEVFSCIKVGDKQDEAIAKLVKLGSKLKYYDMEQGKYTVNFFDNVNEKDILFQIDKYKGMVKLNGPVDFNIVFGNGKVKKFYF